MMAESAQIVSAMPQPPLKYYQHYTDENVKNKRAPKPPPPIKDSYEMFGVKIVVDDQIIRPLDGQIRRLYPSNYDHRKELKKLCHSLLVSFLDLLDILVKCPETQKRADKITDLNLLFIHVHHLINEFRPHQARETLRVMLESQRKQRLDTAQRFQSHLDMVTSMLQRSVTTLPDEDAMDTKLVVKSEPVEPPVRVKMEIKEEEEEEDVNGTLDRMMCNIVDEMN